MTRFATFTADGRQLYGAVAAGGLIALSDDFPDWPTLRAVIAAGGLKRLAEAAEGREITHPDGQLPLGHSRCPTRKRSSASG